jgi:pimeloyl-ACP methyl ester carboxylesterase
MNARKHARSASRLAPLFVAGAAAGVALTVRRAALAAETTYPPEGKFVSVNGVKLHYVDTGGVGPAVILLHGNGATNADWSISGVTGKARKRFRILAFDRPGFGYSERPRGKSWRPEDQAAAIKKAVDQLGVEKPIVVGHSWGALVAAALAIQFPDDIRGAVLASGYYFPSLRADALVFGLPALPIIGDAMRYTIASIAGRAIAPALIRRIFAPAEVPARFWEQFPLALAFRPWQIRASAAESATMVSSARRLQKAYPSIRVPVAIVAGSEDRISDTRKQSARLHDTIPGSRLWVLPRIGHMVHYASPDAIVNAIEAVQNPLHVIDESTSARP